MDELIERVEKVEHERDRYRQLYLDTLERCRMLERGLLGQKAERLPPNEAQLALQVLGQVLEARDAEPEISEPADATNGIMKATI